MRDRPCRPVLEVTREKHGKNSAGCLAIGKDEAPLSELGSCALIRMCQYGVGCIAIFAKSSHTRREFLVLMRNDACVECGDLIQWRNS